jgi:hypothetical protein
MLPVEVGFPATYLHCSMAGSYHVDCTIHGWDDKSERFMLRYFDFITDEEESHWVEYKHVTDWTWPKLLEHFAIPRSD